MSIVIPLMFLSVLMGLFVPRMNKGWWCLLAGAILLVLLYNYVKPPAVPVTSVGLLRKPHVLSARQS